jgi:hypothetical protein
MILAAHTSGISAPFAAEGLGISVVRGQGDGFGADSNHDDVVRGVQLLDATCTGRGLANRVNRITFGRRSHTVHLPIVCPIDSFIAAFLMSLANCPGAWLRAAIAGFAAFDMLAELRYGSLKTLMGAAR